MLIDVSSLSLGESRDFKFEAYNGFDAPIVAVNMSGTVTKLKNSYSVVGKIDVKLDMVCDSCLKNFDKRLEIPFNEIFSNDNNNSDVEYWSIENKTLDLAPAVRAVILTEMPMRSLCSQDCKGLCPKCGHDLNDGDCGCERTEFNPIFEGLEALFKDE